MKVIQNFGMINEHLLMVGVKEVVRRGLEIIARMRYAATVTAKADFDGAMTGDVVTDVDFEVQRSFVRWITEFFGQCNIIAEEDSLRVWLGDDYLTFVFDPVDGTKALARQQSHGIACQIAVVYKGKVIASCVGDANTGEIYYFRPGSSKTHRLINFGGSVLLSIDEARPLAAQNVVCRDLPIPRFYSEFAIGLLPGADGTGGLFKDGQTGDGSFALSCARAWKGEVAGVLFRPRRRNPWDELPPGGISEHLGFVQIALWPDGRYDVLPWEAPLEPYDCIHETLIIHQSRLAEFRKWHESHYA